LRLRCGVVLPLRLSMLVVAAVHNSIPEIC
jgi:hypothetical protein